MNSNSAASEPTSLDPSRPYAFFLEQERTDAGDIAQTASIFLTNRRCPWQCFMCDLWKNTLDYDTPKGAIPTQIDYAIEQLKPQCDGENAKQIKLYSAGSFFAPRAIPPSDHAAIAERTSTFDRVIVECHPALINDKVLEFRDRLAKNTKLEIAMGLETVEPEALKKLNKGMTLEQFRTKADYLHSNDIALRTFILVKPPFLKATETITWSNRSVDFAIDCHATVAALIPTRLGNAPLDQLATEGEFTPPTLATLEEAFDYGVKQSKARVFADLWDLEKFSTCEQCFPQRRQRLERMNLTQVHEPRISCSSCN